MIYTLSLFSKISIVSLTLQEEYNLYALFFSKMITSDSQCGIRYNGNYSNCLLVCWEQDIIFLFTNLKIVDYYEEGIATFVQCFLSKILLLKNMMHGRKVYTLTI